MRVGFTINTGLWIAEFIQSEACRSENKWRKPTKHKTLERDVVNWKTHALSEGSNGVLDVTMLPEQLWVQAFQTFEFLEKFTKFLWNAFLKILGANSKVGKNSLSKTSLRADGTVSLQLVVALYSSVEFTWDLDCSYSWCKVVEMSPHSLGFRLRKYLVTIFITWFPW